MKFFSGNGKPELHEVVIDSLPDDIIVPIFAFLEPVELGRVARVCKRWKMISEIGWLWKKHCNKDSRKFLDNQEDVDWKKEFVAVQEEQLQSLMKSEGSTWNIVQLGPKELEVNAKSAELTEPAFRLRLMLTGDSGVGKSTFASVMRGNPWKENQFKSTIGMELHQATIDIKGIHFKLQVLEYSGRTGQLGSIRSRGPGFGMLLLYDISSRKTFQNLQVYYGAIRRVSSTVKIVVCANKSDLKEDQAVDKKNFVTDEEGMKWAEEHDCKFLSTSCRTKHNLVESCLELIGDIQTWTALKKRKMNPISENKSKIPEVAAQ